ncbi:FAD-binding domain-containing protein [Leucogyrophana mollusca]|uniref:FAD-binding domain-containing protein n=1 Tax=Leucogyrophana mollusca TaxID=85980 RepID=A0ACB8B799_9AGAM|nr:FAD-binding domain-containing protein [Leucogyrophana mollusca]
MIPTYLPLTAIAILSSLASHVSATDIEQRDLTLFSGTCVQIAAAVSSASHVYYPGSLHYAKDVSHWASSSSQVAACSFEPGTAADVGIALQILGTNRTPFAVKGGGHASNPGFSSTTGVQIAMYRFSDVDYDAAAQTATIGAGLIWDDVYAALEPYDVNVVGGRVTGVGVAGFTLGGGYSWLTNQYGLTIDTVTAFELVLPSGTVTTVTEASDPNLFFGLRGGFNNFGIVTRFTLQTFPQGQVWGGLITITGNNIPAVNAATANFAANNTDPKAAIITTYNFLLGEPGVSQLIFYDGPTPPSGIFDDFLAIPYLTKDVSTRSFSSLVTASPSNATAGMRGIFNTVSVLEYPIALIDAIVNETIYYGTTLGLATGTFISYDIEPFLPTLFDHSSIPSAYPPSRTQGLLPLNIYYAWLLPTSDTIFQDAIRTSAAYLKSVAIAEGQDIADAAVYGNYAIYDTPLADIYGANVPTLETLQATVDPTNVMGLAGGFKF